MTWLIKDDRLFIEGHLMTFQSPVQTVIERDGILVVLLQWSYGNRNVYGVDGSGTIIWQIQDRPRASGAKQNPVTAFLDRDGKIALYFFEGIEAILDPQTGEYFILPGQHPE